MGLSMRYFTRNGSLWWAIRETGYDGPVVRFGADGVFYARDRTRSSGARTSGHPLSDNPVLYATTPLQSRNALDQAFRPDSDSDSEAMSS